jgi:hypothetical protein
MTKITYIGTPDTMLQDRIEWQKTASQARKGVGLHG